MLDIQLLIKIDKTMDENIDLAFTQHLKDTGQYISRSEFIRQLINASLEEYEEDLPTDWGKEGNL